MTNPDYRHYLLIVDRSGSMHAIKDEAQAGIRLFVKEQTAIPGKATLTLVQFDSVYEVVHDFTPLKAAAGYKLEPRTMTALLDACGMAITRVGERLAAMPEHERPGKVSVLISTDGKENASREWKREQVRELFIRQQDEYQWQFSYVGANVDAFAEAGAMGIPAASTMNYAASSAGTQSAYAAASASNIRYATGQTCDVHFTGEEREKAAGA
jgi:uncharacterized protein YegL